MSIPSAQCKAVAKHELQIFGGDLKVQAYYDDNKTTSIDILTTLDPSYAGIKSIGTIGLSETALFLKDGTELDTRIELCAGAIASEIYWENAVASTAFNIMKRKIVVTPGSIVHNIFSDYIKNPTMPHVYLTIPFIWNDSYFPELKFSALKINWLQCISIYEKERIFIEKFGSDAFENLLSEQQIDTLNSDRAPIILT